MINCKFCEKQSKQNYNGYCQNCYIYFIIDNKDTWYPSDYGTINTVEDISHKQYGELICHECGKAYSKLMSHIRYCHHMTREEYCKKYGLDKNIQLTSNKYHDKMQQYAYDNHMDDQLRRVGVSTRFKTGGSSGNYKRSYQTQQRLKKSFKQIRDNE